jgi:hypothetical protein
MRMKPLRQHACAPNVVQTPLLLASCSARLHTLHRLKAGLQGTQQ